MPDTREVLTSFYEGGDTRFIINLRWLVKTRWASAVGQLATIGIVAGVLQIELPLVLLLGINCGIAVSNAAIDHWFLRPGMEDRLSNGGEGLVGTVSVIDVLMLTAMLMGTGGAQNPFALFYLVHIVLAAVLLRRSWTWILAGLSAVSYCSLFFLSHPLHIPDHSETVLQWGMIVAFAGVAFCIAFFVGQMTTELARQSEDLMHARQRKAQGDRVEALVTMAAGAAHELSTPLATIAIVAGELERDVKERADSDDDMIEDLRLIQKELKRCRGILDQMSADSGEMAGEGMVWIEISELVSQITDALHASGRIDVEMSAEVGKKRIFVPLRALVRALRVFVKNGLDASLPNATAVDLKVAVTDSRLRISVIDQGVGMSPEVLAKARDPFFTTKEIGHGMGLGLYLAQTVIERLGGTLNIDSQPQEGTHVTVVLPLEESDSDLQEGGDHRIMLAENQQDDPEQS